MSEYSYSRAGNVIDIRDADGRVVAKITSEEVFNCFCNGIFDRGFSLFNSDTEQFEIGSLKQMVK